MFYIGVDLGATNIAAAIVDHNGEIARRLSVRTKPERGAPEIADDIAALCLSLIDEKKLSKDDIAAIGVGIPGVAIKETGMAHLCPNLFWHDVPIRDLLKKKLGLPVYIGNDANAAALAELTAGAFRGRQNCVLITLGSGIGGGIILNGKIFTGAHGIAGEIGHMAFDLDGKPCACGNPGCFERYASANALMCAANQKDAEAVIDAVKKGISSAAKAFERYVYFLARGIVSIINIYDPEIIALGGGLSNAGEFLLSAVKEKVTENLSFKRMPSAEIVIAALGSDAGVIGAAMLAKES